MRDSFSESRRARLLLLALLLSGAALSFPAARAQTKKTEVPLPPPPAGTKMLDAPQASAAAPAPKPAVPPSTALAAGSARMPSERCSSCHSALTQRRVLHTALEKNDCTVCHKPVTAEAGKCQSKTASKWVLVKTEPEICYGCHARKDQSRSVHTAVRQGSCLSCHDAHSSNFPGLVNDPREKLCLNCHEVEPLLTKRFHHAPVAEGQCLECHNPHGSDLPAQVRGTSGNEVCLRCHDAKAPTGKGTPGPAARIDLSKKVVHGALKRADCRACHEGGHGSDNLKLLKKAPPDLCYGCHQRVDKQKYPHGAVLVGDCAVCHDPHSSDQPKLLAKETLNQTCFICHQDDVTGRKVIHAPVAKSCVACHDPHAAPNRNALKAGSGKQVCYSCHQQQVDAGKVKHPALERYGCTGCHDPHGSKYPFLLAKKVNALCVGCHPANDNGTHVSTMVPGGHAIGGGGLLDPRRKGHLFSCASCHNPHGSDNPNLFYYGGSGIESCDGCHGDKTGQHPELKSVINESRPKEKKSEGSQGGGGTGGSGTGGSGTGASGGGAAGAGGGASSSAGSGGEAPSDSGSLAPAGEGVAGSTK